MYVKKGKKTKIENSVKSLIQKEERFGIKEFKTYKSFANKVYKIRENVRKNISKLKKENEKIIGYGSPAKATTALNFFGISKEIDYIVEDNKFKHGKFLPGMKIPIISKNKIGEKVDCVVVLAWNFFNEIKLKNKNITNNFINIKDLE